MAETTQEIDRLLSSAYAPSTQVSYQQGIIAFEEFCKKHNLACTYPVELDIIPHFVAYLSLAGKAFSTAKTYLAALSAKHRLNSWNDPTDTFLVKKLMKGFSRSAPSKDARYPITIQRLQQLVTSLKFVCNNSFEALLFKTAFVLAFFGFFRISELLGQNKSLQGCRQAIQIDDIKISIDYLSIHLKGSKCDQSNKGETIRLALEKEYKELCPVLTTSEFVKVRPKSAKTLLAHMNGKDLSSFQFQAVLRKAAKHLGWPPESYSSHSFRIGAATTAAMRGESINTIMEKGRWKSSAVNKYIRVDKA